MATAVADHDLFRLSIPFEVNAQRLCNTRLDANLEMLLSIPAIVIAQSDGS
jgi:hypothetical protein